MSIDREGLVFGWDVGHVLGWTELISYKTSKAYKEFHVDMCTKRYKFIFGENSTVAHST